MTFVAGWRLAMAADLLRDTDATLDTVARARSRSVRRSSASAG